MNFEKAAEQVKKLAKEPSDDEKLQVYSLYKQATIGDVNIEKPSATDLKASKKFTAWTSRKGMSKEKASGEYVTLVEQLTKKYGVKE
ncbi:hypothetical protein AB6A40_005185 [Gnathostoma spinigerum]|uniref:ACB domain-containing protein n=1 Tax=Gnathostoma spinigerum TaxID=75299 RepID=A0ABD6EM22_9BILA